MSLSSKGSSSGPTKPGGKMVAYCPECPGYPNHVMPSLAVNVTVSPGQKEGSCKNGHTFLLKW